MNKKQAVASTNLSKASPRADNSVKNSKPSVTRGSPLAGKPASMAISSAVKKASQTLQKSASPILAKGSSPRLPKGTSPKMASPKTAVRSRVPSGNQQHKQSPKVTSVSPRIAARASPRFTTKTEEKVSNPQQSTRSVEQSPLVSQSQAPKGSGQDLVVKPDKTETVVSKPKVVQDSPKLTHEKVSRPKNESKNPEPETQSPRVTRSAASVSSQDVTSAKETESSQAITADSTVSKMMRVGDQEIQVPTTCTASDRKESKIESGNKSTKIETSTVSKEKDVVCKDQEKNVPHERTPKKRSLRSRSTDLTVETEVTFKSPPRKLADSPEFQECSSKCKVMLDDISKGPIPSELNTVTNVEPEPKLEAKGDLASDVSTKRLTRSHAVDSGLGEMGPLSPPVREYIQQPVFDESPPGKHKAFRSRNIESQAEKLKQKISKDTSDRDSVAKMSRQADIEKSGSRKRKLSGSEDNDKDLESPAEPSPKQAKGGIIGAKPRNGDENPTNVGKIELKQPKRSRLSLKGKDKTPKLDKIESIETTPKQSHRTKPVAESTPKSDGHKTVETTPKQPSNLSSKVNIEDTPKTDKSEADTSMNSSWLAEFGGFPKSMRLQQKMLEDSEKASSEIAHPSSSPAWGLKTKFPGTRSPAPSPVVRNTKSPLATRLKSPNEQKKKAAALKKKSSPSLNKKSPSGNFKSPTLCKKSPTLTISKKSPFLVKRSPFTGRPMSVGNIGAKARLRQRAVPQSPLAVKSNPIKTTRSKSRETTEDVFDSTGSSDENDSHLQVRRQRKSTPVKKVLLYFNRLLSPASTKLREGDY